MPDRDPKPEQAESNKELNVDTELPLAPVIEINELLLNGEAPIKFEAGPFKKGEAPKDITDKMNSRGFGY